MFSSNIFFLLIDASVLAIAHGIMRRKHRLGPCQQVAASNASLAEQRTLNLTALAKHLNHLVEMTAPTEIMDEVHQNWIATCVLEIEKSTHALENLSNFTVTFLDKLESEEGVDD